MKAGEAEEADSLQFLPAETDGGECELGMMEAHGDKGTKKKEKRKKERGGMLCRQRPQRGVERDGVRQKPNSDRERRIM